MNPDEFRGQRTNKHHPKNKSQRSLTRVRTLQSWLPKPTWQLWFDDEEHERDKDQYETSLKAALPTLVARAIATTKASMLHAVTSSIAAAGRGGASERRLENTAVLQDTNQNREGGHAHGNPHEQGEGEK